MKFKLPGQIASFLIGFLVPGGFVFLALFSVLRSLVWIDSSNIEIDGLGIIVALFFGAPFFIFVSLLNFSLFPELDQNIQK